MTAAAPASARAPARSRTPADTRWFDRGVPTLIDRLPLFGEAMAAVALAWTDGFAALTGTDVAFTFGGLIEARVGALPSRRGLDPVFVVLDAPGWAATIGLQFDRAFVSSVVEVLFGGDETETEPGVAAVGSLSPVEARLAEVIALQATDALKAGFTDVLPSAFVFDRVQQKPDVAFLGRPNATVVVATLRLKALGRTVEIDLLVPRASLDAFAERLAVLPADEPPNADPRWSEKLGGEVSRAPMSLSARVGLGPMTLRTLAGLRVGQVLALPRDAATDVRLVCEGRDLFRCDLGQSGGLYTVRIDGAANERSSRKDDPAE